MINFKEFLNEKKEEWLGTTDPHKEFSKGINSDGSSEQSHHQYNMEKIHTLNPLSSDERDTVWDYSGPLHRRINNFHRHGTSLPNHTSKEHMEMRDKQSREVTPFLDSAINKQTTENPVHVWRGFHKAFNDMDNIKKGTVVSDKGYLSTSHMPHIAKLFVDPGLGSPGHLAHIKVPKGSKALHFGNIETGLRAEGEVLLPRNSKLRYDGKTTHKHPSGLPGFKSTTVHHFTHIPEGQDNEEV